MTKDVVPHLRYILDDLAVLQERTPDSKEDLANDSLLLDAVLMRLIDAGEQFIRIRDQFPDFYAQYETEAWHRIIGLRNVIAHGYNEVSPNIIWDILSQHISNLAGQIQQILGDQSAASSTH